MHFVKKINYIDGYKISLTFNDKKTKIVDVEPYLKKGVFLPLRDPEYFKKVKVRNDTITWPNEADFCPDVLYEIGKDVEKSAEKSIPKIKPIFNRSTDQYS
jgi:hypothetical protein